LSRVRRVVAGGVASALMLSVAAFPAMAIGDKFVPAGECANSLSAVGTPQGQANPGFDNTGGRVGAPAAVDPGESDTQGAQGDVRSGENANNCQSTA